ncbi:MAG TPA: lysoplasmalogenase [Acidimicrobiales bacterium]|nr:lysoplasmalogenase [Acidimicrobiales bacterium]
MTGEAGLLLALALVAAVGDWVAVHRGERLLEYVCKPLTLVLLTAAALALDPDEGAVRTWFVVALVLCLLGDVFLMLPRDAFVPGLASFLLGHVAYIVGLLVDGVDVPRLGIGIVVVTVAVAVIGLTILRAVRAGPEPELTGPVTAYMAVISAMVACAIGVGHPAGVVGAGLFYASDSLIAWNRFIGETRHGRLAIMTTYHLAQVGLVVSLT